MGTCGRQKKKTRLNVLIAIVRFGIRSIKNELVKRFFLPKAKEEKQAWADELAKVLEAQPWKNIKMDDKVFDYSWEGVARDFVEFFGLNETQARQDKETDLSL